MISSTKILLQAPYRDGFTQSHAEANARLAFFLTYFDQVVPLAFNPRSIRGPLILSTELEQQYANQEGHRVALETPVRVTNLNDPDFLDGMAARILGEVNEHVGGFALASREGFSAPTELAAVDRVLLVLENCLPTPHHDTPLESLLAFKQAHQDELRRFHEAVDDLYYGFGSRPLEELIPRLKGKLDAHVEGVLKAYEQRQIKSYMGVLKIGLKLGAGVLGEVIGNLAGIQYVGGLVGGAMGIVVDKTALALGGNAVPKDFEYIFSGLQEGHRRAFPEERPMEVDFRGTQMRDCVVSNLYPERPCPPTRGDFSGTSEMSGANF